MLLPKKDGETDNSLVGYLTPLRRALIEDNRRHVDVVVCESDYRALKRGIVNLAPGCNDEKDQHADELKVDIVALVQLPRRCLTNRRVFGKF